MLCMCSLHNYSTNMPNQTFQKPTIFLDALIYLTLLANVPGNLKRNGNDFMYGEIYTVYS